MSRARRIFLGLGGVCLIATGGVGLSGASFSAQKANPANTFTAAASFCTSSGNQTITADKDTFLDQSNAASTTNGGSPAMTVRSRSNSRNAYAVVGFTLPTKPSGCSVTSATLKVFATSAETPRTIEAYRVTSSWTEAGANWNNSPTFTTPATTSAAGTGLRSWTVTTQVQALYGSSNPNSGFLLKDQSNDAGGNGQTQTYSTREAASNKPTLEVTFG